LRAASIELFAVDLAGRRAILRREERWYLASWQRRWHPLDLGQEQALFLAASMTSVRQHFGTLEGVIAELQRLCAGDPLPPSSARSWEEMFPGVIRRFSPSLDQLFEGRGCSAEMSFRLSLECFLRLFELGPMDEEDVSWMLHQLASDLSPPVRTLPELPEDETSQMAGRVNALDGWRLRKVLHECDTRTLRCLHFHGALRYSPRETAWLVKLPVEDVRLCLAQLAVKLGRSADQLRSPDLAEACIQELGSR
jgi:hypothetical protein